MKTNRISEAMGLISDEISSRAIQAFEKQSEKNESGVSSEKPRVIREEKPHKAPIFIALAGLCAAAAIAVPLVLNNAGKSNIVASEDLSGAAAGAPKVEKVIDDFGEITEERITFSVPEYEDIAFEWTRDKVTANGKTIAGGMPVLQVYLADLTGDGLREIVTCTSWGSGVVHENIGAYDYTNKQIYTLGASDNINFLRLYINNGELWVREGEYSSDETVFDKKLVLSDMKKIDASESTNCESGGAVVLGKTEIPCVDNYESVQEQALDSLVFESRSLGDYTVRLVGKMVYKYDQNVTDYVYAKKLCIEVEKDGKLLDSFAPNAGYHTLNGTDETPEFKVFADKVGSYLDLYELEQPVIAMRYYFGDEQILKKAVQFAVIKDDVVYDDFLSTAETGTGVTLFQNEFAANVEDNLICFASIFEADKFRVADSTTLVDDKAGIQYVFDFENMLKEGKLYAAKKSDGLIESIKSVINNAKTVDELNRIPESIDAQNRIKSIIAFENPIDFSENKPLPDGELAMGAIIQINYDSEMTYITSWGNRDSNPIPLMLSCIIARADTMEQLMSEMNGYNLSLDNEQRLTSISVYASYEDAFNSVGNPAKVIMENGKWVVTTGLWDFEGALRVTYENDKSWFCLHKKGEIA